MHKTMLAALIVAASGLSIPALAQVSLGGAAQVGAGVNAGAAVPNAMHAIDQTGAQTTRALHRADHSARRTTHNSIDKTRSTLDDRGNANTGANADVGARAGIDTAGKAGATGQGVGSDVRDTAHSAIQATDRSAGSVGDAVKQSAGDPSVGADAKVNAKAAAHGH